VGSVDELKQFLEEKGHPVVERWKELEIAEAEAAAEEAKVISEELAAVTGIPISLTNVRIYAKKLIIRGK